MLAGRSQLLSGYPSLYVLLGDCQGVVGHREGDFDTGAHLSGIHFYATNIPFCFSALYPIEPFAIQDREQWFVGNIR